MDSVQILLIINSVLLGFIGMLFMFIGYFLKDLHKDFTQLIERVNQLNTEVNTRVQLFETIGRFFQRQINTLNNKVRNLESKVNQHE